MIPPNISVREAQELYHSKGIIYRHDLVYGTLQVVIQHPLLILLNICGSFVARPKPQFLKQHGLIFSDLISLITRFARSVVMKECIVLTPPFFLLISGAGNQEEEEPQGEPGCPELEQKTASGRVCFMRYPLSWAHRTQRLCRLQQKAHVFRAIGKVTRDVTCDVVQA